MHHLHFLFTIFIFPLPSFTAAATTNHLHRRLLHQPLSLLDQTLPPTAAVSQPPLSSHYSQPQQYPFSTVPPPSTTTTTTQSSFFPSVPSSPPPASLPSSTAVSATIPANISSLVLPSPSHSPSKHTKLIPLIVALSLFSIFVFVSFLLLGLRRYRHYHDQSLKSDSLRLFPPNTTPSDTITTTDDDTTTKKPPPPLFPHHTPSANSSEFLYIGKLVSSQDPDYVASATAQSDGKAPTSIAAPPMNYQRFGSPELLPLPPLPRQPSGQIYNNTYPQGEENDNEEDEDEFFSPRGSTANKPSAYNTRSSLPQNNDNGKGIGFDKNGILNSFCWNSPAYSTSPDYNPSVVLTSDSPQSMLTKSPDSTAIFLAPLRHFIPPPPSRQPRESSTFSPSSTEDGGTRDCSPRASVFSSVEKMTPPPTPPVPPSLMFSEAEPPAGPSELVYSLGKVVNGDKGILGNSESKNDEMMKPKLKPLHWDRVRTSSDRAVVSDQLNLTSFQSNEEMIENLITLNTNTSTVKGRDGVRHQIIPETNQENLMLDPRKSQNIAILLRALNVTVDEVCEALLEGNTDTLGTELLENLLKMVPTKEESPGTAESFLKAVLNVPFAFRRIDAMLYVVNFESKFEHVKRSFDTLESACKELKSSRMFQKLLEALLKTGNRMNIGTKRGNDQAFKLDTLLKLVDVKGPDGKTTLLHFVVREIIKTEGARSSGVVTQKIDSEKSQHLTLRDEVGLQVVSGLSGELTNVTKAAAMDYNVLSNDVAKLTVGISKIKQVIKMNEKSGSKFSENMIEFLKKAEPDIGNIQGQKSVAFSMVKGLTEYFNGDSGKEEARPLRLFMVVRDFLTILDRVCKDFGSDDGSFVAQFSGFSEIV